MVYYIKTNEDLQLSEIVQNTLFNSLGAKWVDGESAVDLTDLFPYIVYDDVEQKVGLQVVIIPRDKNSAKEIEVEEFLAMFNSVVDEANVGKVVNYKGTSRRIVGVVDEKYELDNGETVKWFNELKLGNHFYVLNNKVRIYDEFLIGADIKNDVRLELTERQASILCSKLGCDKTTSLSLGVVDGVLTPKSSSNYKQSYVNFVFTDEFLGKHNGYKQDKETRFYYDPKTMKTDVYGNTYIENLDVVYPHPKGVMLDTENTRVSLSNSKYYVRPDESVRVFNNKKEETETLYKPEVDLSKLFFVTNRNCYADSVGLKKMGLVVTEYGSVVKYVTTGDTSRNGIFSYHSSSLIRSMIFPEDRFKVGVELEKYDVVDFDSAALHRQLGVCIEHDSSLGPASSSDTDDEDYDEDYDDDDDNGSSDGCRGFEVISPTIGIMDLEKVREYFSKMENVVKKDYNDTCGGHMNISDTTKTSTELFKSIKGYFPLLYGLYPKRTSRSYSQMATDSAYESNRGSHSHAVSIRENRVELRIFPSTNNLNTLMWRIELVRIMMAHPCETFDDVMEAIFDTKSPLSVHIRKIYADSKRFTVLYNRILKFRKELKQVRSEEPDITVLEKINQSFETITSNQTTQG